MPIEHAGYNMVRPGRDWKYKQELPFLCIPNWYEGRRGEMKFTPSTGAAASTPATLLSASWRYAQASGPAVCVSNTHL